MFPPLKVDDSLVVRECRDGGVLVVAFTGRVTGANSEDLQVVLTGMLLDEDPAVIMDFEYLSYISSAGLRIMILMSKKMARRGGRMGICNLRGVALEVFHISGLDRVMSVYDTRADAVAGVLGTGPAPGAKSPAGGS